MQRTIFGSRADHGGETYAIFVSAFGTSFNLVEGLTYHKAFYMSHALNRT